MGGTIDWGSEIYTGPQHPLLWSNLYLFGLIVLNHMKNKTSNALKNSMETKNISPVFVHFLPPSSFPYFSPSGESDIQSHWYFTSFWPESPQVAHRLSGWMSHWWIASPTSGTCPLISMGPCHAAWCFYHHSLSTFGLDFFPEAPIKIRSYHWKYNQYLNISIHSFIDARLICECQMQVLCWIRARNLIVPSLGKPPRGGRRTHKQPQYGAYLWNLG